MRDANGVEGSERLLILVAPRTPRPDQATKHALSLSSFGIGRPGTLFDGTAIHLLSSRGPSIHPEKVCIKSPCTSISASSAVLTVHGLLIQTLHTVCGGRLM